VLNRGRLSPSSRTSKARLWVFNKSCIFLLEASKEECGRLPMSGLKLFSLYESHTSSVPSTRASSSSVLSSPSQSTDLIEHVSESLGGEEQWLAMEFVQLPVESVCTGNVSSEFSPTSVRRTVIIEFVGAASSIGCVSAVIFESVRRLE
jgi:hypothetical protein